jgi:hypothetical protein
MPILLAVTLAAAIQPSCSWDRPGQNPYTGDAAAAIDHYADIPEAVRGTLKRRIAEGQSDDRVSITRDGISGKGKYDAQIRDMHFGKASLCNTVTRDKWAAERVEPAAVYCVDQHCILVPRICGNVSRISRAAPATAAAAGTAGRHGQKAGDGVNADDAGKANDKGGAKEFADMRLSDPDAREDAIKLDQSDDFDPDRPARRAPGTLVSTGVSEGGVEEFVMEIDLDSLSDEYARRMAFGLGIHGGSDGIHTAVPEADTWAMLLGGLGLVGWFGRRRRA